MEQKFITKTQKKRISDNLLSVAEALFLLLMIAAVGFMILSQFMWKEGWELEEKTVTTLNHWKVYYDDGTTGEIDFPITFHNVAPGTKYVFQTTLPDVIDGKDWFSTRALDSQYRIYIDGELRGEVTQEFKYFYWEDYTSRYFYIPLNPEDAGKTIRMEVVGISKPSRYFVDCYIGEKTYVVNKYIYSAVGEMTMASLSLLIGVFLTVFGLVARTKTKGKIRMDYLGCCMILVAVWDMSQSFFRDFIFLNLIATNAFPLISLSLFNISIALYLNGLQRDRYRKIYLTYVYISIGMVLIEPPLWIMRLRSLTQVQPIILCMMGVIFVLYLITVGIDIKKKKAGEYKFVLIGMLLLTISGIVQIVCFTFGITASGIFFLAGFILAALFSLFHSISIIIQMEEDKKRAYMEASVKSDFLATMSHEIRTPINAILGMNEAIIRESSEESVKHYATDVDHAGKILLSLINDILDFSKIDSGKMDIASEEYSVRGLVLSCYNMIEHRAKEKNLKFIVDVDSEIPDKLIGDEIRIQQIITNFLTNAVKYTREGRVGFKIFAEPIDEESVMLNIYVSDTGIGIKEEDKEMLFTAFGRIDQVKNRGIEGTGLGLAITNRLVSLMGGSIKVESTYGSGSVFSVKIPQKVASKETVGEIDVENLSKKSATKKIQGDLFTAPNVTLLVVDDVLVNLKVAQSLLKKTGMKIDTAISGQAALDMVVTKKYDIILLDHMMPGKDGVETLHDMRALENNPNKNTPVIMLTANAVSGAKEQYLKEGFDDYLSKPFSMVEIEKMLLRYLPEDKLGGYASDEVAMENEKKIRMIEKRQKLGDAVIPDSVWENINRNEALLNSRNDVMLLRQRLDTFVTEDKRKMLSDAYEAGKWSNYKMILRAVRSAAQSIGENALYEATQRVEAQGPIDGTTDISEAHKALCDEYDRFMQLLKEELSE